MELFRITRSEYKNDLSGIGAYYNGGRWNTPGNAMLYTSSHRSLAMLEILVHWQKTIPPPDYVVVVIFVPDTLANTHTIYTTPDWQEDEYWSKIAGDSWLKEKSSLLMRVPSVVVNSEYNYLMNPLHPDVESIKVVHVEPFEFDTRLFNK